MDQQQLINILFGVAGFCVAWWVNAIWGMVKALQQDISMLHVELAKNYVPRAELEKTFARIFDTMDEIKKEVTHISRNQASIKVLREMLGKEES